MKQIDNEARQREKIAKWLESRAANMGSRATGDNGEQLEEIVANLKTTLSDPDLDPDERLVAVREVSMVADEADVITLLQGALSDPHPEIRAAALTAVAGASGDSPPTGVAMRALSDRDPDVRIAALRILASADDPTYMSAIRDARNDIDEGVRFEAERLLVLDDTGQDTQSDTASDTSEKEETNAD
ncbi:MAG: HEAT repeat domain-containing protein [Candidatus Binatia bacterium]